MVPGVSIRSLALPDCPLSEAEQALLLSARHGDSLKVRALLEAGARADIHDRHGRRPLTLAAEGGHVAVMRALVEAGAELDALDAGKSPWTALMHALHADQPTAALALIEWGADPNVCEDSGYSPLMMAASRGNEWLVDALLKSGADPTAELFLGFTAVDYAIGYGHAAIVRTLLDVAPNLRTRRNPARRAVLALAGSAGHQEILELLTPLQAT